MGAQVPIKICRDSVGHDSSSSSNTDDPDIFQEDAIEEVHNPHPVAVVKQANLILNVPPRSHLEANVLETDHLDERKFLSHPTQSWKVDREVIDEDGPEHPDVEVVGSVVLAKFPEGLDVSDVDGEMTSDDVVSSFSFFDEVPDARQSFHLQRTFFRILLVDGDRDWKLSSILHMMNWSKRDHDVVQRNSFSFQFSASRNFTAEKRSKKKPEKKWIKK